VSAGNASNQAEFEIYANASDLNLAASALTGFPKYDDDSFTWELGSENELARFAFYFRLHVFQIGSKGRCGLELRFNNNRQRPDQQIVEFCIEAYPADLGRLGRTFGRFGRLEDLIMEWEVRLET
jgi:hypothetical protein